MADGKVYMFNINGEVMDRLRIRENSSDETIAGWATSGTQLYQPNGLAVAREKNPNDNFTFAQGENSVSFRRPSNNGKFDVEIPSTISLSDDLILYVARDYWILFRTSGEKIEEGSFQPTLAEE